MQTLDPHRRRLALALAALAGFVDAAGYLSADRYFVSVMSGNTTRLGVELARQPSAAIFPALLALAFVAGVVAGAVLVARREGHHKPALLVAVAISGRLDPSKIPKFTINLTMNFPVHRPKVTFPSG